MPNKLNFHLKSSFLLGMAAVACIMLFVSRKSPASAAQSFAPRADITLTPDQLTLTGDVATRANTVGQCTASWFNGTLTGTIILGVNPTSCSPANWHGGSATTSIFLPAVYSTTVYTLKLSWLDQNSKGLHSPLKNQTAQITLDGKTLWSKRTTQLGPFNDYYAEQHQPILTTIVVTQSVTHTMTISVPSQTAWDLSQIEFFADSVPTTIRGIGYSPFRDCESATTDLQPSQQDIQDDLFRLANTSNAIRTYSATGASGLVPPLARVAGLTTFAGAWLDGVQAADDTEVQALINMANTTAYNGLIVGNEYYLRHRSASDIAYLVNRIAQVRAGVTNKSISIMSAEIDNLMFDWSSDSSTVPLGINATYRSVLDQVDIVLVHIYPYWSGLGITGAADFTVKRYQAIKTLIASTYPGKRVIIGEAGWPSYGLANVNAVPILAHQRQYLREFLALAEQYGVEFMYFDAFDELWKTPNEGLVGKSWGYSYSDRSAKHDFYGILNRTNLIPVTWIPPTLSNPLFLPLILSGGTSKQLFSIYTEWPEDSGHPVPSGWMGDLGKLSLYACDRSNPHGGELAMRLAFANTDPNDWGGIYWQYPKNNWGTMPGLNLAGAKRVTFWVRSDTPGASVKFIIGGIGYQTLPNGQANCSQPNVSYPDSVCPKIEMSIQLPAQWTQYTINLPASMNLGNVVGAFGWVTSDNVLFYLDDVNYESN